MGAVGIDEESRADRSELTDVARTRAELDEAVDEFGEVLRITCMKGDVVEPPAPADDVIGQAGGVARHLEHEQPDVGARGVREGCEPPEGHPVRLVDDDRAEREHVFVEAAEPVEIGGDHRDMTEGHSGACRHVHSSIVHVGLRHGIGRNTQIGLRIDDARPGERPVIDTTSRVRQMALLIGRERELALAGDALDRDRRCVVVGPGGIGKSALARAVASARADVTVAWIDVEPLDAVEAVAVAVARALSIDVLPDETVIEATAAAIGDVRGLIVLDGVEHLADEISDLLARWVMPTAAVLVTSRVPLRDVLPVIRLAPLSMAGDDPLSSAAGRMLIDLVAAHGRHDEDPSDLADALASTGGLPLAVELTARQIARFGAAFAARRGDFVDDEDVIDRSVDRTMSRLDDNTRRVFAALGWSVDAADVDLVAGLAALDPATTLGCLSQLADHGLVFTHDGRFDLLPPIRDRAARAAAHACPLSEVLAWAAEAVVGDGRDEPSSYELFDRHASTFVHLAWAAIHSIDDTSTDAAGRGAVAARYLNAMYAPLTARMHIRGLIKLYTQLFATLDRVGSTLAPDLEGHTARYAAMATSEGATIAAADVWLDRAESAAARSQVPDLVLGRVWSIRSVLAVDAGDLRRAERLAHRSIEASTAAGERFFVEQSRRHLAEIAMQRGDLDEADRLIDELLSWSRPNSVQHTFVAMTVVGWLAVERGDRANVAAIARSLRRTLDDHAGYDTQVRLEADLIWLAADPTRLADTPPWDGDATWRLRLEQRIRRAGALPIDDHWETVLHTAADVVVLADTVPMMQPRLAAGLLLGDAALAGNDTLQARLAFGQALRDAVRQGFRLRTADALDGIAVLATRSGHDELAGQTAGLAERIRVRCGAQPWVRPSLPVRATDTRPVPTLWLVDGELGIGGVDEILRRLVHRVPTTIDATLTRAERQVAHLVADGMTNAEIAAHLVVSRRTVESHLARIFRKLGVRNRTQLARLPLGDR